MKTRHAKVSMKEDKCSGCGKSIQPAEPRYKLGKTSKCIGCFNK